MFIKTWTLNNLQKVCIIFFIATGFIFINTSFAEETISISTGDYAPWTGKKLKHNGFVNHVISEAFKQEGYKVKFKFYPWKRNYEQAKIGKFHATSYWYISKEREKDFLYSDAVSVEKLVFFHLKSKPMKDWQKISDLKGYQIGATREYTYTKEFWDAAKAKQIKVNIVTTDKQNFQKLLSGRIDIYPSDIITGYSILKKDFKADKSQLITYHKKPLSETTGHLLFPRIKKESEHYLKIFNQGLAKLKEKGLYDLYMKDLLAGKYTD